MSSPRERRQHTLRVEQKISARVSDRMFPVRQVVGKDARGQMQTVEAWADMRSGGPTGEKASYTPEDGWNATPPNLPSGDAGREGTGRVTSRYRANYANIDWSR